MGKLFLRATAPPASSIWGIMGFTASPCGASECGDYDRMFVFMADVQALDRQC